MGSIEGSGGGPPAASGDSRVRVLVVDDDEDLRDILRLVLEEEGYAVTTASSGLRALALLCESEGPWVVLLDHYLPGMDGLAVLRALTAAAPSGRHAVIYMSAGGPGETAAVRADLAAMRVPYVSKPFDIEDVLSIIAASAARLCNQWECRGPRLARGPGRTRVSSPSTPL